MNDYSIPLICQELKRASFLLDELCLYRSAQWAQELLIDIQDHCRSTNRNFVTEFDIPEDDFDQHFLLGRENYTMNVHPFQHYFLDWMISFRNLTKQWKY